MRWQGRVTGGRLHERLIDRSTGRASDCCPSWLLAQSSMTHPPSTPLPGAMQTGLREAEKVLTATGVDPSAAKPLVATTEQVGAGRRHCQGGIRLLLKSGFAQCRLPAPIPPPCSQAAATVQPFSLAGREPCSPPPLSVRRR